MPVGSELILPQGFALVSNDGEGGPFGVGAVPMNCRSTTDIN